MGRFKSYLSLIKFSHTIFAMPFALIGFFLGWKQLYANELAISADFYPKEWLYYEPKIIPGVWLKLLWIILCMVFARSAAMAFNRFLDRGYDARNPRTAGREIPSGIVQAKHALFFTIISSLLFIVCTFFINRLCFYLSPVALLVVLGYSYTKRFTALCHLILGIGLALAPIGAYLAVTGAFAQLPVLFSIAVVFWVSGFDIIYALQDDEFDRSQKLNSIPAWLGRKRGLYVSKLLHVLSLAAVIYAGFFGHFGWLYWCGILIFGGMLVYQHLIVKPNDLSRLNIAFMTANGIASVIFAVFVIADLLTGTAMNHLGTYPNRFT